MANHLIISTRVSWHSELRQGFWITPKDSSDSEIILKWNFRNEESEIREILMKFKIFTPFGSHRVQPWLEKKSCLQKRVRDVRFGWLVFRHLNEVTVTIELIVLFVQLLRQMFFQYMPILPSPFQTDPTTGFQSRLPAGTRSFIRSIPDASVDILRLIMHTVKSLTLIMQGKAVRYFTL